MKSQLPRLVRLGIAALLAGACASPGPAPKVLEIANHSRYSIASVVQTPCDGGEALELLRDEIERGDTKRVLLAAPCVDLLAVDSRGRIAGEQRGLEPLSDATWTIR